MLRVIVGSTIAWFSVVSDAREELSKFGIFLLSCCFFFSSSAFHGDRAVSTLFAQLMLSPFFFFEFLGTVRLMGTRFYNGNLGFSCSLLVLFLEE